MTSEIHSVGTGVYVLTTVWIVTLVLCCVALRTGRLLGVVAFLLTSLITLILIALPRGLDSLSNVEEAYDKLYISRYFILSLLIVSAAGGFGFFVLYFCTTPLETKKIKNWVQ